MLQNAVWNNPHGYGLIIQDGDKLTVTRQLNPEGTTPEEVDKLLRDNGGFTRFLHLRWMTEGDITLDNVQPFRVYNKKGHEIWFMHNGTLYDYKPGKLENGTEDPRSDSRIFADDVLTPFLDLSGGKYDESIARKILTYFWGTGIHNRGLLISNKHKPLMLNAKEWKDIDAVNEDGEVAFTFRASNDTYFDKVERGFEYDRREEVRKKKDAERLTFRQDNEKDEPKEWGITKLKDICFKPNELLDGELGKLMDDYDIFSDEGMAALENLTELEIHSAIRNYPISMGNLMVHLTSAFSRVVDERETAWEKHLKATKLIAEMKGAEHGSQNVG
jgi:predicted glutamine amidotransferase